MPARTRYSGSRTRVFFYQPNIFDAGMVVAAARLDQLYQVK
jgi:hypothetical protein